MKGLSSDLSCSEVHRLEALYSLLWGRDGFLLLYKRLEAGRFQWPRSQEEALSITMQQYVWLMEGLSIKQKKVIREVILSGIA